MDKSQPLIQTVADVRRAVEARFPGFHFPDRLLPIHDTGRRGWFSSKDAEGGIIMEGGAENWDKLVAVSAVRIADETGLAELGVRARLTASIPCDGLFQSASTALQAKALLGRNKGFVRNHVCAEAEIGFGAKRQSHVLHYAEVHPEGLRWILPDDEN